MHGTWGLVVSLPATLCGLYVPGKPWGVCDVVGFAAWTTGFVLEAVGDASARPRTETRRARALLRRRRRPALDVVALPPPRGRGSCAGSASQSSRGRRRAAALEIRALLSPLMTLGLMVGEAAHLAEVKNAERYRDSADFKRYRATTSLLWPVPRSLYARVPRSLRACLFFDYYCTSDMIAPGRRKGRPGSRGGGRAEVKPGRPRS